MTNRHAICLERISDCLREVRYYLAVADQRELTEDEVQTWKYFAQRLEHWVGCYLNQEDPDE